jgi:hypothetical protein
MKSYRQIKLCSLSILFIRMPSSAPQFFSFAVGDLSALIALRWIENWPNRNTMEIEREFPKGDPRTEKL